MIHYRLAYKKKILDFFSNLLVLLMTIVIMLALSEVYLRWIMFSVKVIDKEWVNRFVEYNNDGFRDHTYSLLKPDNVFRILVIGDSQTFGHGINSLEDTFPKLLEFYLNEGTRGFRFEVLNFALPGWNTDTHVQSFFKKGLSYQPDLILLVYYHNDIQASPQMKCKSTDVDLFSSMHGLKKIINKSLVYRVLKFRINRGMEQIGIKPTFTQCRQRIYDSRSWNMETLYLDFLFHTTQKQNIHFMMAILPVLFNLEKNYPLDFAHAQLKEYCNDRNIFCIDLFDEVFKSTRTDEVIISKSDRHLNKTGTKLVAKSLFKHLESLKKLRYLTRFEGAFSLQELLNKQSLIPSLNHRFQELEMDAGFLRLSQNRKELNAWRNDENYHFLNLNQDEITGKRISLEETVLDGRGRFIKKKSNRYAHNQMLIKQSILEFKDTHWIEKQWSLSNDSTLGELHKFQQVKYDFRYQTRFNKTLNRFFWNVAIESEVFFEDPFTLEQALFSEDIRGEPASKERVLKALTFYNSYPFFQGKWSREYATLLARDIKKKKPSIPAIKAAEAFFHLFPSSK